MITHVYFVRHAEPDHFHKGDCTRPLTAEGMADRRIVWETLSSLPIDACWSSPYRRTMDTVQDAAERFGLPILTDERLRERENGFDGNRPGMFQKRWADHDYHEEGGESIAMVQARNVEALTGLLDRYTGKSLMIGTHGTALSSIINHYRPEFGCEDFLRIINWMPYILEMDFEGQRLVDMRELAHVEKVYNGPYRADRKF